MLVTPFFSRSERRTDHCSGCFVFHHQSSKDAKSSPNMHVFPGVICLLRLGKMSVNKSGFIFERQHLWMELITDCTIEPNTKGAKSMEVFLCLNCAAVYERSESHCMGPGLLPLRIGLFPSDRAGSDRPALASGSVVHCSLSKLLSLLRVRMRRRLAAGAPLMKLDVGDMTRVSMACIEW